MNIEMNYQCHGDVIDVVSMKGDGLSVQIIYTGDGNYRLTTQDRGDSEPVLAPNAMSLPSCLLHAAEFFSMLPPGTIEEDVYNGCMYQF